MSLSSNIYISSGVDAFGRRIVFLFFQCIFMQTLKYLHQPRLLLSAVSDFQRCVLHVVIALSLKHESPSTNALTQEMSSFRSRLSPWHHILRVYLRYLQFSGGFWWKHGLFWISQVHMTKSNLVLNLLSSSCLSFSNAVISASVLVWAVFTTLRDRSVPNQLINSQHAPRWTGCFNLPEMSLCLCN